MMRTALAFAAVVLTSTLGLSLTMCSSSDEDVAQGPSPEALSRGRFRGVASGGDFTALATIDVAGATSATRGLRPLDGMSSSVLTISGTIAIDTPAFGRVNVTGTLDLATNTVRFSGDAAGGLVTFEGSIVNGVIDGSLRVGTVPVPLSLFNEALGGVHTYCGTFGGGLTGRAGILAVGELAGATFGTSTGLFVGGQGTLRGTTLNVPLRPAGTTDGEITGASVNGTWSFLGSNGTFEATEAACVAVGGEGEDGGAADGGTDGGTPDGGDDGGDVDAGPPSTPEVLSTVAGNVGVGHVAIASGKIYYAYRYAQFQTQLRIAVMNADGSSPQDLVPLTGSKGAVGSLLVAGTKLYYTSGTDGFPTTLESVPLAGGSPTVLGTITGQTNDSVSAMRTDGTWIWRSPARNTGNDGSGVRAYDLDGALRAGPIGNTVDSVIYSDGISLDGNTLYFGGGSVQGGLFSIAKNLTGSPVNVVPQADVGPFAFVNDVVTDDENVYWLAWSSFETALGRKPKSGGAVTQILPAATRGNGNGLLLVDDDLYFTMRDPVTGNGQVSTYLYRVRKTAAGSAPQKVGLSSGYPPVTDGTYVYWSNDKSVMRVHK